MPLNLYDLASDPAFKPKRFKTGNSLYYPAADLGGDVSTLALTQSLLLCWPFTIGVQTTLDRIGQEVTTLAAASTIRLGLYRDDGTCYPGSLLFDAGTIDSTTTGFKEITINQSLPPGLYWTAIAAQGGAPTVRSRASGSNPLIGNTVGTSANPVAYSQAGVTGALPTNFTTTITVNASLTLPKVLVRVL